MGEQAIAEFYEKLVTGEFKPALLRDFKYKYAIAGSHDQFEYWRRYYRIPPNEIRYIHDARHIRGANFSDSYIFFWGLWYESPVIEHEREYLEFACNMISHYSLGASVKDVEPFVDFCRTRNIEVSVEYILDYFVKHSDPNELVGKRP
jgi:hypothetical protein